MKIFKPQLQLVKESEKQADKSFRDHYYLHVITIADKTNYRAAEEDTVVDTSKLESKGVIQVKLYCYREAKIEEMDYLTPLVYFVDLGTPVEKGQEFELKVEIFKDVVTRDTDPTPSSSGSSQTSSSGAEERDRPIGG
ncbi:MAG: hypothetical protein R2824_01785 [Saprospiraceae bacterium]|nr:hypothetical protein [Lewinella sp.]